MDIGIHLTDKNWSKKSGLFYSNLYSQDEVVSFVYQFKFDSWILEYSYEKTDAEHVIRENVKINGKRVIVNDTESCSVNLNGSETLNLDNWDSSISLVKYVYANTVLDKKDKYCSVFLKFLKFVNQMLWVSSTEGLKAIGAVSNGGSVMEEICNLENGVENLESFLREVNLPFKLVAKDKGEGKTIYCQMGNKEVLFAPLMSSGTKSLVFLFMWYMKRKNISFIFIDEFDAFYHTDLSILVIQKLMEEENIQVVFTSHNTDIISNELLRPDCYFILNDNKILPLCDLTDKALREAKRGLLMKDKRKKIIFFSDSANVSILNCPADGNIYMLWSRLKKDEFETNVIDVLKEMSMGILNSVPLFLLEYFEEAFWNRVIAS